MKTDYMKRWIFFHVKLCILSLVTLKNATAQTLSPDTVVQIAASNANAYYGKAIGPQLPLYNGPEYYLYSPAQFRGSAYFKDSTYTVGAVYYDNARYTGIPLMYDLYKDQLVSAFNNQSLKYVLSGNKVQNFDLQGHHFVNIRTDTLAKNTVIKTGYYDELYHGKAQVLVKILKTVQNYSSTTGAQEAYAYFTAARQDYFIRVGSTYYKVSGKGALLDILKDRKKELQQYIKTNHIKYNNDEGQAMVSIASYYDHITN
jgi:hypothetical protein